MDENSIAILLGKSGSDKDLIDLLTEMVTQAILNYCNLNEFPKELEGTRLSMVAELYNESKAIPETGALPVSSISEGGRSVSFDVSKVSYGLFIDDKISKYSILNKFKRLYKLPPDEKPDDGNEDNTEGEEGIGQG